MTDTRNSETAALADPRDGAALAEPLAAEPADRSSAAGLTEEQPEEGWAPKRSRRNIIVFGLVILAGALVALYAWQLPPFGSSNETTDNAYVRGQTTIISPQVGGYVTQVLVQDFAAVKAGQPLVRIDDRIYRERVAQGAAAIATQTANLENSQQSARSSEAQVRLLLRDNQGENSATI